MAVSREPARSIPYKQTPVNSDEFSGLMEGIGFFEAKPLIVAGVSGGADSMALVLLLDAWARSKGGRVIALTVDHGLREGSGTEAEWVARELSRRNIEHHIIAWQGEKPATGIQDKARRARRRLMLEWCREHGVLHLCLAHHANDQVETHLMRLARVGNHHKERDGQLPGLAGMSVIREYPEGRIIRPLLSVGRDRLVSTLRTMNQPWLDDPSNENPEFERVRVRKAVSGLETVGGGVSAIAQAIRHYGEARRDLERLDARALACSSVLYPAGYARLDLRKLDANGDVAAMHALSRLIMALGGRRYPIARDKVEKLYKSLQTLRSKGRLTLGGCLFTGTDDGLLIVREERNLPPMQIITEDREVYWDSRFRLSLKGPGNRPSEAVKLGKLGRRGYDRLVRDMPSLRHHPIPFQARLSLPALYHDEGIVAVTHLTNQFPRLHPHCTGFEKAAFSPPEPVLGGMFSVALPGFCTISDTQITP